MNRFSRFGRERETALKAGVCAIAAAGFAAAWAGFHRAHERPGDAPAVTASATIAQPERDRTPLPSPTARARTSRGS